MSAGYQATPQVVGLEGEEDALVFSQEDALVFSQEEGFDGLVEKPASATGHGNGRRSCLQTLCLCLGLLLGLLEAFGTQIPFIGSEWKDVFSFGLLILLLILKPTGILGKTEIERM